jgi:hypothetical protein
MKKILKVGLCTLLVGAAALAVKDSVDNWKSDLEMNVQKGFISRDGNYSMKSDPKDYGFVLQSHIGNNDSKTLYDDTYASQTDWLRISAMEQKGDLKGLYNIYSEQYLDPLLKGAKKRNLGVRIIRNRNPLNLLVDNNPALQGKTEMFTYMDGPTRIITSHVTLRTTLSMDGNNAYLFTLCYMPRDSLQVARANRFYDDILESFHALKYVSPHTLIAFTIKE